MPNLTPVQTQALGVFDLTPNQVLDFCNGNQVVCELQTQSQPGIAISQLADDRVRCGIFLLHDPGGGLLTLTRFKGNAVRLATAFDKNTLELFGATVLDPELERLLRTGLHTDHRSLPG
jgi:hypothetical protein